MSKYYLLGYRETDIISPINPHQERRINNEGLYFIVSRDSFIPQIINDDQLSTIPKEARLYPDKETFGKILSRFSSSQEKLFMLKRSDDYS